VPEIRVTGLHRCGHDGFVNRSEDRNLSGALADAVSDPDPARRALVMARLAGLSGPGWLRLDESARRPYVGQSPLDKVADWWPVLASGNALAGVVAGSICRDGRVREASVAALARMPGPVAAAALAVRAADWVPEVSSAASAALAGRTGPGDAAAVIPVLLALEHRRRGRQAAAGYLATVAAGPAVMLEALAAPGDRARRVWALEVMASRGLLSTDVLAARAMRDPDPVVALWCARCLASADGGLPPEIGRKLLGSARAGVRAFAVGHLDDDQFTIQALRGLLLDRSGAVRSVARWRWRRQYGDPGLVYRATLSGATRPRQIAAALQGLDDDHDNSLPAAAVPFLSHANPAVRRAAAQAIGRRAEADDIQHHLVPLLLDSSDKVAATALRHVRGHALPASVLATLDAADTVRSRRIALSIRQHSGTWNRIHADLTAINSHDADLAKAARTDLLAWLRHGAATSYGKPAPAQATQIAGLLAAATLSQQQRREIAFVAGIRLPATGS
jgi:hypothetical protein